MASRDIIDLTVQPWIGHYQTSGDVEIFKIKLCLYLEVGNFPLIELGVGKMGLDPAIYFTMQTVLQSIPAFIEIDEQFPKYDNSGTWTATEPLKLDLVTAFAQVSPDDYSSLSIIPWATPTFYEATAYYIPAGDTYTPIPVSIPDMIKTPLSGEGAIFMPEKDEYSQKEKRCAEKSTTFNYTVAWMDSIFIYTTCDLDASHILRSYDQIFPGAGRPYIQKSSVQGIFCCNSEYAGYDIKSKVLTGLNYYYIEPFTSTLIPEYYPPRKPNRIGGVPTFILPLMCFLPILNNCFSLISAFGVELRRRDEGC